MKSGHDAIQVDLSSYTLRRALGKPALFPPIGTTEYGGLNCKFLSGEITLFAEYRSTVKKSGHMPTNFMETGDMYQGFSYTFPLPLEKGAAYRVELGFDQADMQSPDQVAVGDELYYERRAGAAGKSFAFVYRPRKSGRCTFHFLQSHAVRDRVLPDPGPGHVGRSTLKLFLGISIGVTPTLGAEATEPLGRFSIPAGARRWQSPRVYREANHFTPARWVPRPLPNVPWPVEDIAIALHTEAIPPSSDSIELRRKLLRFALDNHFTWANGVSLDIDDPETCALLERFPYLPAGYHVSEGDPAKSIEHVNRLLKRFPQARVLVWFSEPDTTQQWSSVDKDEVRQKWRCGLNLRGLRYLMADSYRAQVIERFERGVVDRKRTIFLWQLAGMNGQGSDWYRFGIDLLQCKTIHRQCMNVVAASCRGAAAPLGKPYALEYDSWNGIYYHQNGDTEPEFYFASLYFAGAKAICNELATVGVCGDEVHPTVGGVKLLEFNRVMRTHPVRGSQLVRIAYMRGADEMWFRPTGLGGNNHPLALRNDIEFNYEWANPDWGLLDVAFPKFGNGFQADPHRTGTGTPYGPVDIISWDLPADAMSRYGAVALIGRNTIDEPILEAYVEYVNRGGTMVLAANSLRQTDGFTSRYLDCADRLVGVRLGRDVHIEPTAYDEIVPHQARFYNRVRMPGRRRSVGPVPCCLEQFPNGDPYIIRCSLGKGTVYFFTTEYLLTVESATVRALLARLFRSVAPVTLSPETDWVEVAIMAKKQSVALALINHGQARYPSDRGADTGPWKGEVSVKLARVGLGGTVEAFALDREFRARRLPCRTSHGTVSFPITVDRWCEVVIGRKGEALDDFFYGEPRVESPSIVGGEA